jgi:hypothetical protein
MLEFVFEFLAELLLQIVGEALFSLGLHSLSEPFRRPANPWLAAVGYFLFGAIGGFMSLIFFPAHLIAGSALRIVNLLLTPVVVGLTMSAIGIWRTRRGRQRLRIDRFTYGYLFAIALALVRFYLAR